MDGAGMDTALANWTMNMDGTAGGTTAYASGVPDASSPLQVVALCILFIFPGLALVVVSLRAAGRWTWGQFGWDDALILVAMFLSAIETAASYKFLKTNYIGIRGVDIPDHDPTEGMIWNYAVQILYNPILALVKLSVLIFLHRLFSQVRGVKACVISLSVLTTLHMVAVAGAIVFQCTPIASNWTPGLGGRCVDRPALYVSTATFTIITDVLVLLLPGYIFRNLNIPRKTKIALLFVFLLGALVTAASVARLITLVVGFYNLVPDRDPTYNIGFVTSAVETNLALITASAPALMPLLRSWFPSLFGGGGESGASKTGRTGRTGVSSVGTRVAAVRKAESEEGLFSVPSLPRSSTAIVREV